MKASELRIGNLVYKDDIFRVTAIRENGLIDLESITYPEDDYCTKGEEDIDPTPISNEWLFRFGFEMEEHTRLGNGQDWQPDYPRSDYRDFIHSEFIIRYDTFTYLSTEDSPGELISLEPQLSIHLGQWTERICEPVRCPEIKYVHQLQNLYFALTGEELTIKE